MPLSENKRNYPELFKMQQEAIIGDLSVSVMGNRFLLVAQQKQAAH